MLDRVEDRLRQAELGEPGNDAIHAVVRRVNHSTDVGLEGEHDQQHQSDDGSEGREGREGGSPTGRPGSIDTQVADDWEDGRADDRTDQDRHRHGRQLQGQLGADGPEGRDHQHPPAQRRHPAQPGRHELALPHDRRGQPPLGGQLGVPVVPVVRHRHIGSSESSMNTSQSTSSAGSS
jgi:hypothetical protein